MPHRVQETPLQILCEGGDDEKFFEFLSKTRGLTHYQATCPRGKDGRCAGKGGFQNHLQLIKNQVPSGTPLKGILIAADSDENPVAAFREVQKSLRHADLPYPDMPLHIRKTHSAPAIAVMMIPWHNRKGNLETVILNALRPLFPNLMPCIEEYSHGCLAHDRAESLLAKFHLRCLIAALHASDPSLSLTYFLQKPFAICPIDYMNPLFDPMAQFLGQFAREALGLLLGPGPVTAH